MIAQLSTSMRANCYAEATTASPMRSPIPNVYVCDVLPGKIAGNGDRSFLTERNSESAWVNGTAMR
jgi:hypothetical protein